MGAFLFFITLLLLNFQCLWPLRVVIVVVWHIAYYARFSGYRADMSCFTTKICLFITIQTNRCGRVCFSLTLLLSNLNAYRVCACSLSVVQQVLLKTRNRADNVSHIIGENLVS